jgi:hypothetical protein
MTQTEQELIKDTKEATEADIALLESVFAPWRWAFRKLHGPGPFRGVLIRW